MAEKLGQHYLVNPLIAENIVDILSPQKNENIIEIGPGKGFLTSFLMDKGSNITGIEIDKTLAEYLIKNFKNDRLKIINADFLKVDLSALTADKICGNIPYQISGKIIEKVILSNLPWKKMVLMLPLQVARRVVAKPGESEWGAISIMSGASCRTYLEFTVGKENFEPEPEINSAVVSFFKESPPETPEFYRLVKASFTGRRKKIKNSLAMSLGVSAKKISEILKDLNISSSVRSQSLTVKEFRRLTEKFVKQGIL